MFCFPNLKDSDSLPFGKLLGFPAKSGGSNEDLILNPDIIGLIIKTKHLVQFYRLIAYLDADSNVVGNNAVIPGSQDIDIVFSTRPAPELCLFLYLVAVPLQVFYQLRAGLELKRLLLYFHT